MRWIPIFFLLVLGGCVAEPTSYSSTTPLENSQRATQRGDMTAAYRLLEGDLIHSNAGRVRSATRWIQDHPQIYAAAKETFSPEALASSMRVLGPRTALERQEHRLSMFHVVATDDDYSQARNNVSSILKPAAAAEEQRLAKLLTKMEEAERHRVENAEAGRIIDAQVQNLSTSATHGGAALGQAIGSAAYVDNAYSGNWRTWNYSAKNHLATAVVGGVIGSMADSPATTLWRVQYTIRMNSGETRTVVNTGSTSFHQSVGVCVAVIGDDLETVNESRCGK
ncbi:hypothetical protein [Endothiovibrio diazotrophicus]